MKPDPVERHSSLETWIDVLVRSESSVARDRALLSAALELGCRAAWLWRREHERWLPVAAQGEGSALPAEALVRQVLEGRLPESLLGGSGRSITARRGQSASALALFPDVVEPSGRPEELVDELEALLVLAHALGRGEDDDSATPHGPLSSA